MEQWKRILNKVLRHGEKREDRTKVGTLALFGEALTFDNRDTFPAVTTKKLAFNQMAAELACFIQGYQNLEHFNSMGCSIWDGNGTSDYWSPHARGPGDLGRIYGVQWRDWRSVVIHEEGTSFVSVDQLKQLVDGMRKEPHSRRHVVTALNPGELNQMCLPPCHVLFQAYVSGPVDENRRVDLCVYMRSVDLFLGLPFDIASYALLQRLIAKELGMDSGFLTFFLGDAHIYLNHVDQVNKVLAREEMDPPWLWLSPEASLFNFHPSQAELRDYKNHGPVPAVLNV
jgi:thymidylate synthase